MLAGDRVKAICEAILGALLCLLAGGCIDDPLFPSEVESLRVLGLTSTPAEAIEGEIMTLDLL